MDMRSSAEKPAMGQFLDHLRQAPFVEAVEVAANEKTAPEVDVLITIRDRQHRPFRFYAEVKHSYLDRAAVNGIVANARLLKRENGNPLLLLARYVPLPTGERLMEAGINFVDRVGNMHLVLGDRYERTIVGRVESRPPREKLPATPAQLQVLFLFATQPDSVSWPVRNIAAQAGVSKSKAAEARSDLVRSGFVRETGSEPFRISAPIRDLLVSGYSRTLRPKLLLGRFRAPERELSAFLERIPDALKGTPYRYALSGGPAAQALQHFYLGPEAPLFVNEDNSELRQRLRLLPDRTGPVILLRTFGELVFWRKVGDQMIAPPWLVYSELMNATDPRAHEAASELSAEYLHA